MLKLHLEWSVPTAVEPSANVCQVAAMFGLGVDESKTLAIVPPTTLELHPGQVVFITGPSGSGKSSLLRLINDELIAKSPQTRVLRFDGLTPPGDKPLVDGFADLGLSLEEVTTLLSLAGLGDAFVMLRKPGELSEGQRYRLQLARLLAQVRPPAGSTGQQGDEGTSGLMVILADEFGATLDRITAKVIARNLRRWVRRSAQPVCLIVATTHDDLLEALEPEVLMNKGLGTELEVMRRGSI